MVDQLKEYYQENGINIEREGTVTMEAEEFVKYYDLAFFFGRQYELEVLTKKINEASDLQECLNVINEIKGGSRK